MLRQLLWVCFLAVFKIATCAIWKTPYPPYFTVCNGTQCDNIAKIFRENINPDLEPCDEFYNYGCQYGEDRSRIMFTGQAAADLKELLTGPLKDYDSEMRDFRKALHYETQIYKSCEDHGIYTEEAKKSYENQLLYDPPAIRLTQTEGEMDNRDRRTWSWYDLDYAKRGFGFAFFNLDITENERTIQISPLSDDVLKISNLLSSEYIDYEKQKSGQYKDLVLFMRELNKLKPSEYTEKRRSFDDSMKTLERWQQEYNLNTHATLKIDFYGSIKEIFRAANINLDLSKEIVIKNKQYFIKLDDIFQTTKPITIEKYLHLRFISKTIGFVQEKYKDSYSLVPSIPELKCTPGLFIATAFEYADKQFPSYTRETVKSIFNNVRNKIKEKFGNIRDNEQVKQFLQKLDEQNIVPGYPDWLTSDKINEISRQYFRDSFTISKYYWKNQMQAIKGLLPLKLMAYLRPELPILDMDLMFESFTADEWHYPLKNDQQILIPIRIFGQNNYKFLSAYLWEPINYGSFGTILAAAHYYKFLTILNYYERVPLCVKKGLPELHNLDEAEMYKTAASYLLALQTSFEANPQVNDSFPMFFPEYGTESQQKVFFLSFIESICGSRSPVVGTMENKLFYHKDRIVKFIINSREFEDAFVCERAPVYNPVPKCDPLEQYNFTYVPKHLS